MAVEPSTSSPSSTDQALIAEIALPMLEKLKRDGKDRGLGHGSMLQMLISVGLLIHIYNPDWHPEIFDWYPYLIGAVFLTWLILPWYFGKRSVAAELTYRRQHGKWRWER